MQLKDRLSSGCINVQRKHGDYITKSMIIVSFCNMSQGCILGLVPGNSRPGNPGNFPKIFSPAWSREFFRFPGKFREIFMYCDWQIFRFHSILEIFLWAQNQTLLSKMIVTKLKIILLPQKMHFLSKMGYFRLAIK